MQKTRPARQTFADICSASCRLVEAGAADTRQENAGQLLQVRAETSHRRGCKSVRALPCNEWQTSDRWSLAITQRSMCLHMAFKVYMGGRCARINNLLSSDNLLERKWNTKVTEFDASLMWSCCFEAVQGLTQYPVCLGPVSILGFRTIALDLCFLRWWGWQQQSHVCGKNWNSQRRLHNKSVHCAQTCPFAILWSVPNWRFWSMRQWAYPKNIYCKYESEGYM